MIDTSRTDWWLVALRGLVAALFGVLALLWPTKTATVLVILIALFILIDGVFSLVVAARSRRPSWGLGLFEGVVGVAIGVLALAMPQVTAMVLAVLVGLWALVTGVLELFAAIRLREQITSEWLLGAAGVVSILFGIAIFVSPGAGVAVLTMIVGIYAVIFGVSLIVYGLRIRKVSRS